jgi:hypothetical protein
MIRSSGETPFSMPVPGLTNWPCLLRMVRRFSLIWFSVPNRSLMVLS